MELGLRQLQMEVMRQHQTNYREAVINSMKYRLSIILCFCCYIACAQKTVSNNIDSIYYLIDASKTPVKERMLDIGVESTYQYFTIKCPCLKYNAEPTFVYKIKDAGQTINRDDFDKLKTVSLRTLINLAKQTVDLTATTLYVYFFIEKKEDDIYIVHKVRLITPRKREVIMDYETIPIDSSKKVH